MLMVSSGLPSLRLFIDLGPLSISFLFRGIFVAFWTAVEGPVSSIRGADAPVDLLADCLVRGMAWTWAKLEVNQVIR
jgi:hypothetical protein